jgi:hypothetical protein
MLSTETQTIELDVAPAIVFDILADPRRIPEWASAFADRVSEDPPHGWQVIKGDDRFAIRMVAFPQSGTVDYLRQIAPGREAGAYIRVLPKSTDGSVVVMTLPVPPGTDSQRVRATLRDELAALGALARAAGQAAH